MASSASSWLLPADEAYLPRVCTGSHAQALLARMTRTVALLVYEVPELPGETFAAAAELLRIGCDALERIEAHVSRADADGRGDATGDDAPSRRPGLTSDNAVGHPAVEEWLASGADTVTGEVDRRRVLVADLLTLDEVYVRHAGQPRRVITVGAYGPVEDVKGTWTRRDELLDRLTEAIMLVKDEVGGWLPQTRAQAITLMRDAGQQLAGRCER